MRRPVIRLLAVASIASIALVGCNRQQPIGVRAMTAYKSEKYAEALPLLKEWAAMPNIRNDPNQFKQVMAYVVDTQQKLAGTATGDAKDPQGADDAIASARKVAAQQAAAASQAASTQVAVAPNSSEILDAKSRVPHVAWPKSDTQSMTIKAFANFDFDPTKDTDVPKDVHLLDGEKVRLRGFMIPISQSEEITEFALVPSLVSCCFGQPPGVQHTITCHMPKGKAVEFSVDELWVQGTVHVHIQRDQDYTYSLFDLDVDSVKPAS